MIDNITTESGYIYYSIARNLYIKIVSKPNCIGYEYSVEEVDGIENATFVHSPRFSRHNLNVEILRMGYKSIKVIRSTSIIVSNPIEMKVAV